MEEMKLYHNLAERERYENLAELYAIIVTTEQLERAYVRDWVSQADYTPACSKLIAQYKSVLNLVGSDVPDVQQFMADHKLNCPAAWKRLQIGVPLTVEHATLSDHDPSKSAKYVAETVQNFITLIDSLKLNRHAVDEIHPILSDLMQSLNNVSTLPVDFEGKAKLLEWLINLNQMRASDELEPNQVRQLLFDLENAHHAFYRFLSSSS
ncbi:Vacuolar protein-sorting-associated protein 28 [Dimargaris cristalligena]|uniref:Vacuolar protein sorting-associated protein 28 n=1 Tax=Dimargaris cristalligena TaxID=215637 RepID=A0A4P9ZVA6_9FUNG|nr:Vacuolar protein-sorting-associated protein 28 [Dimargaris cristalligena]RKP37208.1 vacuolar protein sorting-associated protein 28 [Dimargaris cristalligena]|eukprot:RKP37208.1 vacuolar protein sorting-associated protein 28 [Dimargaris cristalligena]